MGLPCFAHAVSMAHSCSIVAFLSGLASSARLTDCREELQLYVKASKTWASLTDVIELPCRTKCLILQANWPLMSARMAANLLFSPKVTFLRKSEFAFI